MTFSPRIQNFIDSSGKEVAIQRYAQIQAYVDNYDKKINGVKDEKQTKLETFADVLKTSDSKNVGFRVLPSKLESAALSPSVNSLTPRGNITKAQIQGIVSRVAQKYQVDEKLVNAVIRQESGFNPKATSHCGAMGLMQLMPNTAKELGVKDAYNPLQNIEGGVKYLSNLLKRYNGNTVLALAAYNAGPSNVDKYSGVPPFSETQNYVKNILANYL